MLIAAMATYLLASIVQTQVYKSWYLYSLFILCFGLASAFVDKACLVLYVALPDRILVPIA